MKILSLESSGESCSVALCNEDRLYSQIRTEARQHAKLFLPLIDEVFAESGLALTDLDAIAFGQGPGSFTGVRICMSVVQGLAFGAQLPVIPVSTLAATAAAYFAKNPSVTPTVSVGLDARMSEVYLGKYQLHNGVVVAKQNEAVLGFDSAIELIEREEILVGSAWALDAFSQLREDAPECQPDVFASALDILAVAKGKFVDGELQDIGSVEPVYLRDEVAWEKRVRIRN